MAANANLRGTETAPSLVAMFTSFSKIPIARVYGINRAIDLTLIWLATILATRADDLRTTLLLGIAVSAMWLFAGRLVHQYAAANGRGFYGDVALTLSMLAIVLAPLGISAHFFAHAGHQVVTLAELLVPATLILRFATIGTRLWHSEPTDTVLVVGAGPLGRLTANEIAAGDRRLLGHLVFDDEGECVARLRAPVIGAVRDLEETLKEHVVDEVYFASTAHEHSPEVQKSIQTCERLGVPFALPVCSYRLARAKPVGEMAEGDGYAHFLSVRHKPLQLWVKRLFDIVASSIALALLTPLLVVTAIAVKVTSRGPVLFKQKRVGLHGRTFDMLKFRSMVVDAEALKERLIKENEQTGPVFKMKRDPRITAVGRFIRRFSIDELPQFVNVLRGDMSIVGPRPPIPSEVAKYEAWQRRRLSVRPGLTCVWQVSGRNEIGFREWMLLDMRYIDHWSLVQDFQLILRTVPVVLTGRGAS